MKWTYTTLAAGLAALLVAGCATAPRTDWSVLPAAIDGAGGEAWLSRHPSGNLILFGRHDANWQNHRFYVTRHIDGAWTEPQRVTFDGDLDARAPHFAPDGRSVLFASARPSPNAPNEEANLNIWRVTWDGENWGEPQPLPAPINSAGDEIDAVEVNGGVIYFSSIRNGIERPDIYRASPDGGTYRIEAVSAVNTPRTESTLYVSPDERVIVFSRDGDPVGLGRDDLFIARRTNGAWSAPTHLAAPANSDTFDYGPELSPDGRTLTLTTHSSGRAAVIAVDIGAER